MDDSDSISYTDIDSEMDSNYSKSSGGSLSVLTEICTVSPPKRKVGRPPKKDKKMKRNGKLDFISLFLSWTLELRRREVVSWHDVW
jgi:hypothetical protein